ncbi:hypothetical protein DENSPDRAFT_883339 [Dentipellis sp. KUC8613]|nr:hypothetical protein DENSPDRAFT_883339 [Dentipellis sp. KUC8613]
MASLDSVQSGHSGPSQGISTPSSSTYEDPGPFVFASDRFLPNVSSFNVMDANVPIARDVLNTRHDTMMQDNEHGDRMAASLDRLANKLQLDDHHCLRLHGFAAEMTTSQTLILFAEIIRFVSWFSDIQAKLEEICTELEEVKELSRHGWQMSDQQKKLIKGLVCHWLVKPVIAYGAPVCYQIEKYIAQHTEKLQLMTYNSDAIVKASINKYIQVSETAQRSNNRSQIMDSVAEKEPLDHFVARMIAANAKSSDKVINNTTKAQFALMRITAHEIILAGEEKNGKLWKHMDAKLAKLAILYGKDCSSTKWDEWNTDIIKQDEEEHH